VKGIQLRKLRKHRKDRNSFWVQGVFAKLDAEFVILSWRLSNVLEGRILPCVEWKDSSLPFQGGTRPYRIYDRMLRNHFVQNDRSKEHLAPLRFGNS